MTYRIGIIAEDSSDVEVLSELIAKISPNKRFIVRKFVAHGCGKIRGKCRQWALQLNREGCRLLILLHDLDTRTLSELKVQLENAINPSPIKKHVLIIPVREIEAWLLSDSAAIERALNLSQRVPYISNPESIVDPKKTLGEVVFLKSGKTKRYIVNDNKKIASRIRLESIRRCSSFLPLECFVRAHL